ncbi:MAG: hypothetical protein QOG53_47 [Frankiales bacterium]|jgi:anti-anti-sigma factor|nr:hypothetical protein [Frankiales bacterium]
MNCRAVCDDALTLPTALVGEEVDRLRPALLTYVRQAGGPIVSLDATDVELISSSGLGLLVAAALVAQEHGRRLQVRRCSELFRESIALTGLAKHLDIAA